MYINDAPQTHGVYLALFADASVYMRRIARRVLVLENSSAVSAQWMPGVSTGISKLLRIRLRGSTSLKVIDRLRLILHERKKYSFCK
jgi:hypothetical protein